MVHTLWTEMGLSYVKNVGHIDLWHKDCSPKWCIVKVKDMSLLKTFPARKLALLHQVEDTKIKNLQERIRMLCWFYFQGSFANDG